MLSVTNTENSGMATRPSERMDGGLGLSSATIRGGGYLAARYGLGVFISIANMLALTWWIGPHAYGIFLTGIGLVAFLANISRAGIDTYLVRHNETPTRHLYDVATTLIALSSTTLLIGGAAFTPFLIRWYGSREFAMPYLAMLLTVPLIGLTGIPMARLERELNFRAVAKIECLGQFLGLVVSTALAWLHCGVWAPVCGQIVWQVFTFVAAWKISRLAIGWQIDHPEMRRMLKFGLGCTASLRVWQLRTLVNPLLVGRFVGVEGVAFVGLALRIAEALGTFRLAAGRMALAALARVQRDREQFYDLLQTVTYWQVITLGPLLCVFAIAGPVIFRHVVGLRWLPSLRVFPFIAAGVLINSIYNLQASALFVTGHQWIVMRAFVSHVVLLALASGFLLPHFGILGYGWAEVIACSGYLIIHLATAERFPVSYRKLTPLLATFLIILFL
jgi:O-antigen/teichoic acid export membrane protein